MAYGWGVAGLGLQLRGPGGRGEHRQPASAQRTLTDRIFSCSAVIFNPTNMKDDTRIFVRETVYAASQTQEFKMLFTVNATTNTDNNEGGLIFHSGMTGLDKVHGTERDMRAYLGESFNLFSEIRNMAECTPRRSNGAIVVPTNPLVPGSPTQPMVIVNKKQEGETEGE